MKYFITFLLISFIYSIKLFSQQTSNQLKRVDDSYCLSITSPMELYKGDTVFISCDKMYLINERRYDFYKQMHEFTSEDDKNKMLDKLVELYENNLKEREDSYAKLLANCKQADRITQNILYETQKTLIKSESSLNNAQNLLSQTTSDLEKANELLKKQKLGSLKQKILIGAGGVGIGLLVGLLIYK